MCQAACAHALACNPPLTHLRIYPPHHALQVLALLKHDRDLVKKKALLVLHRFLQLDPVGVGPDVEKHLVEKIGYKVCMHVCLHVAAPAHVLLVTAEHDLP
jgi:hypothetical protein